MQSARPSLTALSAVCSIFDSMPLKKPPRPSSRLMRRMVSQVPLYLQASVQGSGGSSDRRRRQRSRCSKQAEGSSARCSKAGVAHAALTACSGLVWRTHCSSAAVWLLVACSLLLMTIMG